MAAPVTRDLVGVLAVIGGWHICLYLGGGLIALVRSWRGRQLARLKHEVTRLAGRLYEQARELDWTREQASENAAEALRRSRQLAQLIGHPAAGDARRYVGRDQ